MYISRTNTNKLTFLFICHWSFPQQCCSQILYMWINLTKVIQNFQRLKFWTLYFNVTARIFSINHDIVTLSIWWYNFFFLIHLISKFTSSSRVVKDDAKSICDCDERVWLAIFCLFLFFIFPLSHLAHTSTNPIRLLAHSYPEHGDPLTSGVIKESNTWPQESKP